MNAIRITGAAVLVFLSSLVQAQDYPNRPLRLILANAPGSSIDTMARIITTRMGEVLGQAVIVENRDGAAGAIGMEAGKNSKPDGYTLVCASSSAMTVLPALRKNLPYDPVNDFTYISNFAIFPNVLVVHPSLPINNVRELVDFAKSNAGKVNMASAGVGNMAHLSGELFMSLTGTRFVHVPYKGGGPAMTELLGGQVALYFSTIIVALPHIRAGKLRALAVTGTRRASVAPELPTIAEAGVAGYAVDGWYAMLMPAQTPPRIITRFANGLHGALQAAEVKQRLATQGIDTAVSTPDDMRKIIAADLVTWRKVVRDAGIQPE